MNDIDRSIDRSIESARVLGILREEGEEGEGSERFREQFDDVGGRAGGGWVVTHCDHAQLVTRLRQTELRETETHIVLNACKNEEVALTLILMFFTPACSVAPYI